MRTPSMSKRMALMSAIEELVGAIGEVGAEHHGRSRQAFPLGPRRFVRLAMQLGRHQGDVLAGPHVARYGVVGAQLALETVDPYADRLVIERGLRLVFA